jgi:hypothetical protein
MMATFLDTAGPLAILGAQLVYLGQPFLRGHTSSSHLQAIADVLEDTDKRKAFVSYLRGESIQ